jgi:nitroreductase
MPTLSSSGRIRSIKSLLTSAARLLQEIAVNTLTKFTLGLMGQLRPKPAVGDGVPTITLPPPDTRGGVPLMEALGRRASGRDFATRALTEATLSNLLWAANGINRAASGGRTAPSALDAQEVDIFVALPAGGYRYEAAGHKLQLVAGVDLRRVTGYQDFVDTAPLDLVYVADYRKLGHVPVAQRESLSSVAAGAIAQNVYLFCASAGLSTVLRAWIDRYALADALGLTHDQQVLLSQTVGYPQ